MNAVRHHPKTETLAAFAAGHLGEATSALIAAHLEVCDECRGHLRDLEAIGGALLDAAEPEALSPDALDQFWARADAAPAPRTSAPIETPAPIARALAAFPGLADCLDDEGLAKVKWRRVAPGVAQHVLSSKHGSSPKGGGVGGLSLLKIAPGVAIPKHAHGGRELTMVLRGAYVDEHGRLGAGDVADLDENVRHSPTAFGDEHCICLIAAEAPLRFEGVVGRLLQPFVRF